MWRREYISVIAEHRPDGTIIPRRMTWIDGTKYKIEHVDEIKPCAARKAGGHGMRYTVTIKGQTRHLFREVDRWFVEYDGPDEGSASREDGA